jgi:Flp pilus assembly protein TadG
MRVSIMHSVLNCRRGSVALMFGIAAIPLIGFAALGTEAGTWYLAKRHAQNAADASAIAGALTLASGGNASQHATNVATADGFCNGCSPSASVTQSVNFAITATSVTAIIVQSQPALLARVFALDNIDVAAQATASVQTAQTLCMLSLATMTIQGNASVTGGGCSMMTNTNVVLNSAPTLPADSTILANDGCGNSSTTCSGVTNSNYYMPKALLPPFMLALDATTAFPTSAGGGKVTCKKSEVCSISSYEAGPLKVNGDLTIQNDATLDLPSGTYFFKDAKIDINGGGRLTNSDKGGVNIVLLGTSSLTVKGTVTLTAKLTNPLFGSVLSGVLIYDRATGNVDTTGNSGSYYGGALYFANADVTWGGNAASSLDCTEIVAKTITLSGTSDLGMTGCKAAGIGVPTAQVIVLTN